MIKVINDTLWTSKVIVVGAGLAGLSAANELVRSGSGVEILEAATGPVEEF